MIRLSNLPDVSGPALLPGYEPAGHGVGIVHLGLGAFHRAHQAVMTDAALSAGGGDWRIVGVSLRSRGVAEAMARQDNLYTVVERDGDGARGRVVAAIARVIAADPAATLAALTAPEIRIVTLTVTEKAYGIDRRTGAPDPAHPGVAADLAAPDAPSGVLGLLTAALRLRRGRDIPPLTILCCDNLPANGAFLRGGIIGFARRTDPALADWIEAEVAFPACMVDRITPAPTDATRRTAADLTGCDDRAAVETEPFLQWVIENRFPQGRPAWEAGGAVFVDDVEPYERMKLRMLNGAHSMLAYAGGLAGHENVRDAMADPALARLVRRHLDAAAATLAPLPDVDFGTYAGALLDRFANPAIAHRTAQIAMDGTEKLPQRIWSPGLDALRAGLDVGPFAFATAAWMARCLDEADLDDPRAAEIADVLRPLPRDATTVARALHDLPGLIPVDLARSDAWCRAVTDRLARIVDRGVRAAIEVEASA